MIPCPFVASDACGVELQRVTPHADDPVEYRGSSPLQVGIARHMVVIHSLSPADAIAVARSWSE
jgi:hypothetical protein